MITSEKHAQSLASPSPEYATPDHQLICELAKDLAPYKIAIKFDLPTDAVKRICARYGVPVLGRHKLVTLKTQIMALHKQGMRQCQIANQLNVDDSMVRKYLWEAGIKSGVRTDKSADSVKKAKQIDLLRKDGMTAQDACNAVGISLNTYYLYRNKKAP